MSSKRRIRKEKRLLTSEFDGLVNDMFLELQNVEPSSQQPAPTVPILQHLTKSASNNSSKQKVTTAETPSLPATPAIPATQTVSSSSTSILPHNSYAKLAYIYLLPTPLKVHNDYQSLISKCYVKIHTYCKVAFKQPQGDIDAEYITRSVFEKNSFQITPHSISCCRSMLNKKTFSKQNGPHPPQYCEFPPPYQQLFVELLAVINLTYLHIEQTLPNWKIAKTNIESIKTNPYIAMHLLCYEKAVNILQAHTVLNNPLKHKHEWFIKPIIQSNTSSLPEHKEIMSLLDTFPEMYWPVFLKQSYISQSTSNTDATKSLVGLLPASNIEDDCLESPLNYTIAQCEYIRVWAEQTQGQLWMKFIDFLKISNNITIPPAIVQNIQQLIDYIEDNKILKVKLSYPGVYPKKKTVTRLTTHGFYNQMHNAMDKISKMTNDELKAALKQKNTKKGNKKDSDASSAAQVAPVRVESATIFAPSTGAPVSSKNSKNLHCDPDADLNDIVPETTTARTVKINKNEATATKDESGLTKKQKKSLERLDNRMKKLAPEQAESKPAFVQVQPTTITADTADLVSPTIAITNTHSKRDTKSQSPAKTEKSVPATTTTTATTAIVGESIDEETDQKQKKKSKRAVQRDRKKLKEKKVVQALSGTVIPSTFSNDSTETLPTQITPISLSTTPSKLPTKNEQTHRKNITHLSPSSSQEFILPISSSNDSQMCLQEKADGYKPKIASQFFSYPNIYGQHTAHKLVINNLPWFTTRDSFFSLFNLRMTSQIDKNDQFTLDTFWLNHGEYTDIIGSNQHPASVFIIAKNDKQKQIIVHLFDNYSYHIAPPISQLSTQFQTYILRVTNGLSDYEPLMMPSPFVYPQNENNDDNSIKNDKAIIDSYVDANLLDNATDWMNSNHFSQFLEQLITTRQQQKQILHEPKSVFVNRQNDTKCVGSVAELQMLTQKSVSNKRAELENNGTTRQNNDISVGFGMGLGVALENYQSPLIDEMFLELTQNTNDPEKKKKQKKKDSLPNSKKITKIK